jgi:hypothetical protein
VGNRRHRRDARQRILAWSLGGLLAASAPAAPLAAQSAPEAGQPPRDWPYRLPLGGQKLAERGIAFPLPWGVGLNYIWLDQPITIKDLAIAINDGEFHNLDEIVAFDSVNAAAHGVNLRTDLWVLPVLNVYGLFNYIAQAKTDVSLSEPFPLTAGAVQNGLGGGLGATLAGGWWGFFGTLDFNWTRNRMEKLEVPVDTLLTSIRVGHRIVRIGKWDLTGWLGTMYQRIGVATRGSIGLNEAIGEPSDEFRDKVDGWYDDLPPGRQAIVGAAVDELRETLGDDPVIRYKLDKRVSAPWNMLVGAQLEINEHWQLRTEVGFIQRTQVLLGFNYRFGLLVPIKKP